MRNDFLPHLVAKNRSNNLKEGFQYPRCWRHSTLLCLSWIQQGRDDHKPTRSLTGGFVITTTAGIFLANDLKVVAILSAFFLNTAMSTRAAAGYHNSQRRPNHEKGVGPTGLSKIEIEAPWKH